MKLKDISDALSKYVQSRTKLNLTNSPLFNK